MIRRWHTHRSVSKQNNHIWGICEMCFGTLHLDFILVYCTPTSLTLLRVLSTITTTEHRMTEISNPSAWLSDLHASLCHCVRSLCAGMRTGVCQTGHAIGTWGMDDVSISVTLCLSLCLFEIAAIWDVMYCQPRMPGPSKDKEKE